MCSVISVNLSVIETLKICKAAMVTPNCTLSHIIGASRSEPHTNQLYEKIAVLMYVCMYACSDILVHVLFVKVSSLLWKQIKATHLYITQDEYALILESLQLPQIKLV